MNSLTDGVAGRLVVGLGIDRLHRRHVGVGNGDRRGRDLDLDVTDRRQVLIEPVAVALAEVGPGRAGPESADGECR